MDYRAHAQAEVETLTQRFPNGLRGHCIHAIGVGGIGISGVVQVANARGASVSGCDVATTSGTRLLMRRGIPVTVGHSGEHLIQPDGSPVDLVVATPAVAALNPHQEELAAAEQLGIPVTDWQALWGYLSQGYVSIAVAGVHGKGTTTAMLGALATAGGLDPTVQVGAIVPAWGNNVRLGRGTYAIYEADEWNYNFLHYRPRMVVLTAIEHDHPEFFTSYEAIRDAFLQLVAGMDLAPSSGSDALPLPVLVLNADNVGCRDISRRLRRDWPGEVRTFGIASHDAIVRAEDVSDATPNRFRLRVRGQDAGMVELQTPGVHNVHNALAAAAGADALDITPEVFARTLSDFTGLRRRFEISHGAHDITYVDDYAHHPHAVALTLATARRYFAGRRLIAVFQPTLYTRLHRFLDKFSASFDDADEVVIVEIQPSRERDTGLIHGQDLVDAIRRRRSYVDGTKGVRYGGDFAQTVACLDALVRPTDVVVVMGSGPVNQIIPPLRDRGP